MLCRLSLRRLLGHGGLQLLRRVAGEPVQRPARPARPASSATCPRRPCWTGQPLTNVAPGKGGVERDPLTIPAHTFPGACQHGTAAERGHADGHGPARRERLRRRGDHRQRQDRPPCPDRFAAAADDPAGAGAGRARASRWPWWMVRPSRNGAGVGDPAKGYYAGLPGKGYAKILMELWTEITPTGAYWNPTRVVSDNRLPAFASDASTYAFAAPTGERRASRSRCSSAGPSTN